MTPSSLMILPTSGAKEGCSTLQRGIKLRSNNNRLERKPQRNVVDGEALAKDTALHIWTQVVSNHVQTAEAHISKKT